MKFEKGDKVFTFTSDRKVSLEREIYEAGKNYCRLNRTGEKDSDQLGWVENSKIEFRPAYLRSKKLNKII